MLSNLGTEGMAAEDGPLFRGPLATVIVIVTRPTFSLVPLIDATHAVRIGLRG